MSIGIDVCGVEEVVLVVVWVWLVSVRVRLRVEGQLQHAFVHVFLFNVRLTTVDLGFVFGLDGFCHGGPSSFHVLFFLGIGNYILIESRDLRRDVVLVICFFGHFEIKPFLSKPSVVDAQGGEAFLLWCN